MVKIREEIGYIRQKSFRFFDSTILDAVSFKKYNKHNIWYIWEEKGSGRFSNTEAAVAAGQAERGELHGKQQSSRALPCGDAD